MSLKRYSLVLALLLVIALVIVVAPVSAAVVTIDPTTPGGIAGAISAAGNGDTIILEPGTYDAHGISSSGKNLIIKANASAVPVAGSQANTIIDAQSLGRFIYVTDTSSLTLDNLTLKNGNSGSGGGGAIASGGNVTLSSSTITNCLAGGDGGAIWSNGGVITTISVTIISSTISGCSTTGGKGGAIFSNGDIVTIMSSSTISNCLANGGEGYGGAIDDGTGTILITGSTITGCEANDGGAINSDGTITITSSTISGCSSGQGGAINSEGGTVTLTSSTITGCSAQGEGGAIYSLSDNIIIEDSSTISDCSANNGGAIDDQWGSVTITSSIISNCWTTSGGDGGAIQNYGDNVVIEDSSMIVNCSAADGSGGAIDNGDGTVSLTTSMISYCWANEGGAISTTYYSGGHPAPTGTPSKSVSLEPETPLIISGSTITGCYSTGDNADGGAIYSNSDGSGPASFSITDSTLFNCSAIGNLAEGGAIYDNRDTATIATSTISNCSVIGQPELIKSVSADSEYMNGDGGAIFDNTGPATIISSTIINCSATGSPSIGFGGGAIFTAAGGSEPFTMHFCRIYNDNTGTAVVYTPDGAESIDLTNNWWGSNEDPSVFIDARSGTVISSPWLILGAAATPYTIAPGSTSAVLANLTFNSAPAQTSGGGVFVPNGIPVSFAIVSGPGGGLSSSTGTTTNGVSSPTTFTAGAILGTATVNATVDAQNVSAIIVIANTPAPISTKSHSAGTCYWCTGSSSSGSSSGYTGPSTTQAITNPTQMPTVVQPTLQPTVINTINQSAAASLAPAEPPLPTNTPKSGIDAVPVLGALGLCGAICLVRKNGN
ncbi:MAG: hypothetical protein ABSG06_03555 [Methanoregula sp.]